MSYCQKSLGAFNSDQSDADNDADLDSTGEPPEVSASVIAKSEFAQPDDDYPEAAIRELADDQFTPRLCVQSGVVEPSFATIAGRGGMGGRTTIENKDAVYDAAVACLGLPVVITGGGTGTPMGSGAIYGRLTDATLGSESVSVTVIELFHENGTASQDENTRTLGAYQLSVPATVRDCKAAVTALSQWEDDTIEFLDPTTRQRHEIRSERFEAFEALSPADRVHTPEYSTQLEVISEPFKTYAVISRGTLNERTVRVLSVAVSNPNGGFYQLGIDISDRDTANSGVPVCYLSQSQSSPPTPNTAFTRAGRFPSTKLDVTTIEHPPDPTVIPPDEDVQQSPLPEPRMQTSLDEIQGVGQKSTWHIRQVADSRVTVESLAHTLYGDGAHHQECLPQIRAVLDQLPNNDAIYGQLESFTPVGGGE